MALLRNCYTNRPGRYCSPSGKGFKNRFTKIIDDNTKFASLIPIEKIDLYSQIQSYLGQTDVSLMCRRALNGEVSVFSASVGSYTDVSKLPEDYNTIFKNFADIEKAFNMIPADVKGDCLNIKSFLKSISTVDGICAFNQRYNDFLAKSSKKNVPPEVTING